MPKKRRKVKRKRETGLPKRERCYLLTGMDWHNMGVAGPELEPDDVRDSWELYRAELVDYWRMEPLLVAAICGSDAWPEPAGPGHRPAAWWWFDAPEPKRAIAHQRVFERPASGSCLDYRGAVVGVEPVLELEEEYLARLGLLTDDEREWLAENETKDAKYREKEMNWRLMREELATAAEIERFTKQEDGNDGS